VAKTFPDYFEELERLGMLATSQDRVGP